MAKRSARALSRTRHLDQLGGGRWPFCDGTILSVLDALRTHGGAWGMAGQRLRLQPCTRYMPKGLQANYQERKAFTSSSSLCERSLLPTGRPVDEGRSGANRRCRGRRSPPRVRLRQGELRRAAEATDFRSIASPSAERFGALRCFLRSCCM